MIAFYSCDEFLSIFFEQDEQEKGGEHMEEIEELLDNMNETEELRERIKRFFSRFRSPTKSNILMICLLYPFDIRREIPSNREVLWALGFMTPSSVYRYKKILRELQSELLEV